MLRAVTVPRTVAVVTCASTGVVVASSEATTRAMRSEGRLNIGDADICIPLGWTGRRPVCSNCLGRCADDERRRKGSALAGDTGRQDLDAAEDRLPADLGDRHADRSERRIDE